MMAQRRWAAIARYLTVSPLVAIGFAVALVVASLGLAVHNERVSRAEKVRQTIVQARILAGSVAAPLAFDDRAAAQEYVGALRANPEIEAAGAYDGQARLVAGFGQPGFRLPDTVRPGPARFDGGDLIVTAPVSQGETGLGSVYLRTATETLARRVTRYLGIALIVTMASLLVAVLGASHATLSETLRNLQAEIEGRRQAEEALRQAQKMEAMGQLTGGVAHDFNNLLTPIIGSLDMLNRRSSVSDRDKRLIDGALQSAERARTLVQRLLAFARRQPLQVGAVDVAALVGGMVDLVASTAGPQIRMKLDIEPMLPPALADSHQLEMALLNLCVNARDAMPDGGTLTIAASAQVHPGTAGIVLATGHYIRLSVIDTGTGMDAQTIRRAIEPFYSTKGIGKGTGLGLSMVHGLTSQLNGGLEIGSSPGAGTRIDLWLPASDLPLREATETAVRTGIDFRGRALIVDDEDAVRHTTCEMMAELGFETIAVSGAAAAEAALRSAPFDLVVTDHLMPDVTGAELARTIRTSWPQLPVLLVSGYAESESIDVEVPRLTKPFRRSELEQALMAMMLNRSSRESLPGSVS